MSRHLLLSRTWRWVSAALFSGALALGALAARPAVASMLVPMDLEALSVTADRILVGTVEKVESHLAAPGSSYIVTDVTVRSERELLGVPAGTTFLVRHLGGTFGDYGQRVYGEASYTVGEQVLLFAAERRGVFYSVGMAQGALHVTRDSAGVRRVETHLAGAEFTSPLTAKTVPTSGRALDEVVAEVQTYLSRRTSAPRRSQ